MENILWKPIYTKYFNFKSYSRKESRPTTQPRPKETVGGLKRVEKTEYLPEKSKQGNIIIEMSTLNGIIEQVNCRMCNCNLM